MVQAELHLHDSWFFCYFLSCVWAPVYSHFVHLGIGFGSFIFLFLFLCLIVAFECDSLSSHLKETHPIYFYKSTQTHIMALWMRSRQPINVWFQFNFFFAFCQFFNNIFLNVNMKNHLSNRSVFSLTTSEPSASIIFVKWRDQNENKQKQENRETTKSIITSKGIKTFKTNYLCINFMWWYNLQNIITKWKTPPWASLMGHAWCLRKIKNYRRYELIRRFKRSVQLSIPKKNGKNTHKSHIGTSGRWKWKDVSLDAGKIHCVKISNS